MAAAAPEDRAEDSCAGNRWSTGFIRTFRVEARSLTPNFDRRF
jgi:hypothetical protein